MSATAEEVLRTLQSIDAGIKALLAHFGATTQPPAPSADTRPVPTIASDRDMDGRYGDPKSRCDPKDWTGKSFKGEPLSTCPPDYLDLYADLLLWFAQRNDENNEKDNKGRPKSYWDRKDSALAKAWAQRLRNGWTPPAEAEGFPSDTAPAAAPLNDSDIPFTWLLPLMLPTLLAWHAASMLC